MLLSIGTCVVDFHEGAQPCQDPCEADLGDELRSFNRRHNYSDDHKTPRTSSTPFPNSLTTRSLLILALQSQIRAPAPLLNHHQPPPSPNQSHTTANMPTIPLTFWNHPLRYLRTAAHEKPAIFWSVVLGSLGPISLAVGRPFREWIGDEIPKAIPGSYPGEYTPPLSWGEFVGGED
jgi:hypothetical protein